MAESDKPCGRSECSVTILLDWAGDRRLSQKARSVHHWMEFWHYSDSHAFQMRKPACRERGFRHPSLSLHICTTRRVFSVRILVAWLPQLSKDMESKSWCSRLGLQFDGISG